MPRIVPLDPEQASGETGEIFREMKSVFGMVPNLFRTSAQHPPLLRANWSKVNRCEGGVMRNMILAFALVFLGVNAWAGPEGFVTKPGRYSVPETMDRLATVLQSKGMTVFARIDHASEAAKVGLKMRPTQLLIFGNPKGGTPLMVAAPTVAIDLPFKALVWQDGNGKVWLGYNTPEYLKHRHRIEGKDEALKTLAGALDAMAEKSLE